ncbi:cytadherence protein C [Mycoplasma sp. E35C]|uniref:cytadherence protein C n=1 Tax=Mycoplasma sp. E35C TaxID=2801918 RepID=UPI001CA444EF|nr:cytadherence protein C [Mycoplasma sp. E35C]QZX49293.1 cytadherence protein C [Mycoplasma sp. E35C]
MKSDKKYLKRYQNKKLITVIISIFVFIALLFSILGISLIKTNHHHNNQTNPNNYALNNHAGLLEDNTKRDNIKANNNFYVQNANNDYFVMTKTGIQKLDVFGNLYYQFDYGMEFANYETVDLAANTIRPNYYYLLIKNPLISITGSGLISLVVNSPAFVLELYDDPKAQNPGLTITKRFRLDAYQFSRDLAGLYAKVGFEPKLADNASNDELNNAKQQAVGLLDRPANTSFLNNLSYFYYHSISKIAFLNNRLAIFGSNDVISIWYYLFNINQTNEDNNQQTDQFNIYPRLFANTNFNWTLKEQSNSEHTRAANFVVNNVKLYTPAYFVAGINVVKQELRTENDKDNNNQLVMYSLHLGLIPAPISKVSTTSAQYSHIISSSFYSKDDEAYSNIFVSGAISQSKIVEITNNFNTVNDFFSSSFSLKLSYDSNKFDEKKNNLSQYAYHYSVQIDNSTINKTGYANLIGILVIRLRIVGFIFSGDDYKFISGGVYNLFADTSAITGFQYITNIIFHKGVWWLAFYNPTTTTTWINELKTTVSRTNRTVLSINYSEIYKAKQGYKIFLILALSQDAFYSLSGADGVVHFNLIYFDQEQQSYINADFYDGEIPAFDNKPESKGSKLWGMISFKPESYLSNNQLSSMNANDVMNSSFILNKLVDYKPGIIKLPIKIIPSVINDRTLKLDVLLPYFNGEYYGTKQALKNLDFPSIQYDGLDANPVYVVPTIVVTVILIIILIVAFVFLILWQINKSRKVAAQLFNHANNKIDKLNDSVNTIYQKIETKLYNPANEKKKLTNKFNKPNENISYNIRHQNLNNTRFINPNYGGYKNPNGFNSPRYANPNYRPTTSYYNQPRQVNSTQAYRMQHPTKTFSQAGFNNKNSGYTQTSFWSNNPTKKIN